MSLIMVKSTLIRPARFPFVNAGVLQDEVIAISPLHVMIALRELPFTAGVAHEESCGDGFISMAPEYHPVLPIKTYMPPVFIRKSSNTRHVRHGSTRGSAGAAASRELLSHVDCK